MSRLPFPRIPTLTPGRFALAGWVLSACLLAAGCKHEQTRLQIGEEAESREKEYDLQTVGGITSVANADPVPVSGVGLVVGLEGTGGSAPPGGYRTLLEDQLAKDGVTHLKELLASPETSMVLVSALIPAGAHKGDPLDVEVVLPEGSRTTSLRGGYLKKCYLFNYDSRKNLSPTYSGPDGAILGHRVAVAEGPLLVGFGDGEETVRLRQGRIWGGARSLIARPFVLVLSGEDARAPIAQQVADRINETFHGPFHGALSDMASPKTGSVVYLKVPQQYRHNLHRYLRVVRLIPLEATPAELASYRRRLEEQLQDPAHTVTAALRLEALGRDSAEPLKHALASKHALVRFSAAEALAYLGEPACGEELALLAERQPALRAFCLTAMASLDESICRVKLRELLASDSAETRYGAFRALRTLDEQDPAVQGEYVNESFWLHRTAPHSKPLVHLCSSRRAEVVLFGEDPRLEPPFSFLAGEFTVTAGRGDRRCTISRFSVRHGTARHQCSLDLEEVLHTMARMGALYPDVVEVLRQMGKCQCLNCAVAVDALPQATSVYDLARSGAGQGDDLVEADEEINRAREDFGATPTLYEKDSDRRSLLAEEQDRDADRKDDAPPEKEKPAHGAKSSR